jgi:hypothetical protein
VRGAGSGFGRCGVYIAAGRGRERIGEERFVFRRGRKLKSTEVVARILKGTHCQRTHQMFTALTTGQASAVQYS